MSSRTRVSAPRRTRCRIGVIRVFAVTISVLASCRSSVTIRRASRAIPTSDDKSAIVVHDYKHGLDGVRAVTGALRLSLRGDSSHIADSLLVVEYSPPTSDPAARDVRLEAATTDWTAGHALSFRILPASAVRLSVSFLDRNRVAYTSWIQLDADRWQTIRIPFETLRPNPYFQPPDAKTGTPLDVSRVTEIAFAPQSADSGRLVMSRIVVVK